MKNWKKLLACLLVGRNLLQDKLHIDQGEALRLCGEQAGEHDHR